MSIPNIGVGQVQTIGTTQIWLPHPVLTDQPIQAIPIYGPVTSPDMIGVPIIDMPGCVEAHEQNSNSCLLYTSPSPRDATLSRMPSSA